MRMWCVGSLRLDGIDHCCFGGLILNAWMPSRVVISVIRYHTMCTYDSKETANSRNSTVTSSNTPSATFHPSLLASPSMAHTEGTNIVLPHGRYGLEHRCATIKSVTNL